MPKSAYLATRIVEALFEGTPLVVDAVFVGLLTQLPDVDGVGYIEMTDALQVNYARVRCYGTPPSGFPVVVTNGSDTVFNQAGFGGWGTPAGFGFFDAQTGGNLLGWGTLPAKVITEGDIARYVKGALVWQEQ